MTEYQTRHGKSIVPVCHDGVCFFERQSQPKAVAMTSLSCRSYTTCHICNGFPILEIFIPKPGAGFSLQIHKHVEHCADITGSVDVLVGLTPYVASSVQDLEIWLWRFCCSRSKFRNFKPAETGNLLYVEQMAYCSDHHPRIYNSYYQAVELFLVRRKYMLFK